MATTSRKRVFLTGATGHMGSEVMKRLAVDDSIELTVFSLPTRRDRRILAPYRRKNLITVVEGDLRNYEDVRRGVKGADYVLHVGALIPPRADRNPKLTRDINYGGTLNVLRAIGEEPDPDHVRLVYISTVASMGNRPAPIHWGRVGDPIRVSHFDAYAASKVQAERAVIDSGLKYWVSIRQSGMLHKDILRIMEPIIFHQPLDNHIEWSTAEDSGRALHHLVGRELPDQFWRNVYNLGSGPSYRETYFEFMEKAFRLMGIDDIRRIFRPRDFATDNFHCVWYADSDELEHWLRFRSGSYDQFWRELTLPWYYQLAGKVPPSWIRRLVIEPLSRKEDGPQFWSRTGRLDKLSAFFGSRARWEGLPVDWRDYHPRPNRSRTLRHGFNRHKTNADVTIEDCRTAAHYRGGECLSAELDSVHLGPPLEWRCGCGETFRASPILVLRAGHWCPRCDIDVDRYPQRAKRSPFFAQVFEPAG